MRLCCYRGPRTLFLAIIALQTLSPALGSHPHWTDGGKAPSSPWPSSSACWIFPPAMRPTGGPLTSLARQPRPAPPTMAGSLDAEGRGGAVRVVPLTLAAGKGQDSRIAPGRNKGSQAPPSHEVGRGHMVAGGTTTHGVPWTEYLALPEVARLVAPHQDLAPPVVDGGVALGEQRRRGGSSKVDAKVALWRARSRGEVPQRDELGEAASCVGGMASAMQWERVVQAKLDAELKLRMWRGQSRAARHKMVTLPSSLHPVRPPLLLPFSPSVFLSPLPTSPPFPAQKRERERGA